MVVEGDEAWQGKCKAKRNLSIVAQNGMLSHNSFAQCNFHAGRFEVVEADTDYQVQVIVSDNVPHGRQLNLIEYN